MVCPGFTSDCLETLEEIAIEGRDAFLRSGGKEFNYIPCLNDQPEWITALCSVVQQHTGGWATQEPIDTAKLEQSRARATAMGASR